MDVDSNERSCLIKKHADLARRRSKDEKTASKTFNIPDDCELGNIGRDIGDTLETAFDKVSIFNAVALL